MEPLDKIHEELSDSESEQVPSVDEFIKQLEEREKDLDISSDLVIEVGESEVVHDNIHDTFVSQSEPNLPPAEPNTGPLERPVDPLSAAVPSPGGEDYESIIAERDEALESFRRQKRDFDSYRQRTERERKEIFKNMLGSLATQMLPVLDNLNRALDATPEQDEESNAQDFKVFQEGIVLVNQQLNEVLAGMGVQPIPAMGEPFDPNIHEAVASVETDEHPHRTVIQELLRGYRIDDKVIRASMVKVSAKSTPQSSLELDVE